MDPHVRWLRRRVMTGIAGRVAGEAMVVAVAVGAAVVLTGAGGVVDLPVAAVLAMLAGQVFVAARFALAVISNPVNSRYLSGWIDPSSDLRPADRSAPEDGEADHNLDEVMAATGFAFATRLVQAGTAETVDVYRSRAGTSVFAAVDRDHRLAVISRLSDDRMVVTTPDLIPPVTGLVINLCKGSEPAELAAAHLERLQELTRREAEAVDTDHRAVTDQLHLEWEAWDQLGPIVGPLLAIDHRRRPLTLHIRVDPDALWDRTVPAQTGDTAVDLFPAPSTSVEETTGDPDPVAFDHGYRFAVPSGPPIILRRPASILTGPPPMPGRPPLANAYGAPAGITPPPATNAYGAPTDPNPVPTTNAYGATTGPNPAPTTRVSPRPTPLLTTNAYGALESSNGGIPASDSPEGTITASISPPPSAGPAGAASQRAPNPDTPGVATPMPANRPVEPDPRR